MVKPVLQWIVVALALTVVTPALAQIQLLASDPLLISSYAGDTEALESLVRKLLALNPDSERVLEIEAIRAYRLGDLEAQRRVLDRLSAASSEVVALAAWNVAIATREIGGIAAILEHLTQASRPADVRAIGHASAAFAEIARGRPAPARQHLEAASRLDPGVALMHETLVALLPFLPAAEHGSRSWADGCRSGTPPRSRTPRIRPSPSPPTTATTSTCGCTCSAWSKRGWERGRRSTGRRSSIDCRCRSIVGGGMPP